MVHLGVEASMGRSWSRRWSSLGKIAFYVVDLLIKAFFIFLLQKLIATFCMLCKCKVTYLVCRFQDLALLVCHLFDCHFRQLYIFCRFFLFEEQTKRGWIWMISLMCSWYWCIWHFPYNSFPNKVVMGVGQTVKLSS